ncbi:MAG: VOC family protein [Sphingorhabdus sp.]
MENRHGDFIWYELMTTDADGASAFYSAVIGWDIEPRSTTSIDYRMISAPEGPVAGLLPLTSAMLDSGARSCWTGYIAVDDVDENCHAIMKAGGKILMEPWNIAGTGRLAFACDPQGAAFYTMKPVSQADRSAEKIESFAATTPIIGHCAWNELATTDPQAAKTFYGGLFGWVQNGDMDMGPLGKYEFLQVGDERGIMLGAVMPKMPEMPVPMWTYYFRVADIDKAVTTARSMGGRIIQDPTEIPGGYFSMVGSDPQGAPFALVGARQ